MFAYQFYHMASFLPTYQYGNGNIVSKRDSNCLILCILLQLQFLVPLSLSNENGTFIRFSTFMDELVKHEFTILKSLPKCCIFDLSA